MVIVTGGVCCCRCRCSCFFVKIDDDLEYMPSLPLVVGETVCCIMLSISFSVACKKTKPTQIHAYIYMFAFAP